MPDDRFTSRTSAHHAPDRSPGALVSTLLNDFSDLMRKEIALAKGELSHNITQKVMGSVWMAAAGVVFLIAVLTLVAGIVVLIASLGLALHWSAFIVAGALAVIGLIMFFAGKSKMSGDTMPTRSMAQVQEDVRVVKEQMK
jgi:VIT1/CCC1 family predicted Fe2+/Mn2+ transporter